LVTEDNEDTRDLLLHVLKKQGWTVSGAQDGREAFKKLKTMTAPTLVLLDLMMPVMDGWEFLEKAQKLIAEKSIVVVAMSAVRANAEGFGAASDDMRRTSVKGIASTLYKPLYAADLKETVEKYCGPSPKAETALHEST
jgi:CheY-like chemotaxis protein